MIDLVIAATIARDLVEDQFAGPSRRGRPSVRAQAPATVSRPPARAPMRRAAVRGLRAVADRLEPAQRCVPQA
jgi:hypothetical protein